MKTEKDTIICAFDTNTFRSKDLIPFLILNQECFKVLVPAIIYTERLYSFFLAGGSQETFNDELNSYKGEILPLEVSQVQLAIKIAYKCRKTLPFRHHARDYFIGCQCQDSIDIFITYNKKHFEPMDLKRTKILTPEEFITTHLSKNQG
jgi:predicted nucleic acid-binding protein